MVEAVFKNKQDFLRLLLEKGLYGFSLNCAQMILWSICFLFRVDPNVKVSHGGRPQDSAVEYAVDNERNEALAIMQEFKIEIPNDVKFKRLVFWTGYAPGYGEKAKKEFARWLQTLPVDLVKLKTS